MTAEPRAILTAAHAAAVAAVAGDTAVERWLNANPIPGDWHVVAVGKAAAAMTEGAWRRLGDRLRSALVITREGYTREALNRHPSLRQLQASHPVPDERSLAAGAQLLDFVAGLPTDGRVLFLVSGGASSLVEVLPAGVPASALAELNRRLLADGLDIHAMNRVRKAVSRIKGGRLARHLGGREALALIVSDVRGDDPAVIGSGLLFPGPQPSRPDDVPQAYRSICPPAEPGPTPGDADLTPVRAAVVASNLQARQAAADALNRQGVEARVDTGFLDAEAEPLGRRLAEMLRDGPAGAVVHGGEPTVTLPAEPGEGGRMQALALAAATRIDGADDVWLLAAGTDGADGPTEAAGALVDGGTVARGRARGLDPEQALQAADAGAFLEASGDRLRTGPTGTNVMDLVIAWKR
jgi:hydroxypyruvate reductase